VLIDVARRAADRYGFNINPTFTASVPGDLGGYGPLGVARVQANHSGPMYHTSGDVFEMISVPGLERAARFFALRNQRETVSGSLCTSGWAGVRPRCQRSLENARCTLNRFQSSLL
jgi:hypothetical protein